MVGRVGFESVREQSHNSDPGDWQRLGVALGSAWRLGWQPLDLHRLASNRLGQRQAALLSHAIADEMRSYPAQTVDPRWRDQLVEIGALPDPAAPWGRLDRMPLYRTDRPAWLRLMLEVSAFVAVLPRVQVLLPPPGQGSAGKDSPATDVGEDAAAEVDDRILRRVRALLAKAESTQYPEEADTYTTAAQRLMTRHRIDAALLAASSGERSPEAAARRVGIDSPYEAAKVMLLSAVADANGCRTVWSKGFGFCTVVGAAADLQVVEGLFTSLLLQAGTAMQRSGSAAGSGARSRTRSFRKSFLHAFAVRIGERLTEASEAEVAAASAEPGGGELVPVLAARAQEVDQAVDALFGRLRRTTTSSAIDGAGWASGLGAADRAHLGSGSSSELRS